MLNPLDQKILIKYARENIAEKTWRKKIYAQNGKSKKNSKIHYLLLVMSIERTIEMAQKLCDFGSCWVFLHYLIRSNDAISYTKQIKSPFEWPNFYISTMMAATISCFIRSSISNWISMSENYGRSNWKEMKNKVKFKCTQFRTMACIELSVCPCGRTSFLCNADTYIATGTYPQKTYTPFFWFCDKNEIPAD